MTDEVFGGRIWDRVWRISRGLARCCSGTSARRRWEPKGA